MELFAMLYRAWLVVLNNWNWKFSPINAEVLLTDTEIERIWT